jgi:hypothetical protein
VLDGGLFVFHWSLVTCQAVLIEHLSLVLLQTVTVQPCHESAAQASFSVKVPVGGLEACVVAIGHLPNCTDTTALSSSSTSSDSAAMHKHLSDSR